MEQSTFDTTGPDACLSVCDVLVDSIKQMKQELKNIYNDQELPLEERWYFFTKVPPELQDNHGYILSLDNWEDKYGRIQWYDKFVYDKYQEVSFVDLIEDQIRSYFYDTNDELVTGEELKDALEEMKPFTPDNLEEFKKEILEKGYHSFTFDW